MDVLWVLIDVAPRCIGCQAWHEQLQGLPPIHLAKVCRCAIVPFKDGIPIHVDKGAIAEKSTTCTELVALHVQSGEHMHVKVVERSPHGWQFQVLTVSGLCSTLSTMSVCNSQMIEV
jgi:hypothetical protein